MKQTATEWLIDEAMKLVVQYMQGTLNEDTLDDVIYKIGTKAKEMEKKQAERMYTYDEIRAIAYQAYCLGQLDEPTEGKYNLWIQQLKKK